MIIENYAVTFSPMVASGEAKFLPSRKILVIQYLYF